MVQEDILEVCFKNITGREEDKITTVKTESETNKLAGVLEGSSGSRMKPVYKHGS